LNHCFYEGLTAPAGASPPRLEPDRPVQEQARAEQIIGSSAYLERRSKQACTKQGSPQGWKSPVKPLATFGNSAQ